MVKRKAFVKKGSKRKCKLLKIIDNKRFGGLSIHKKIKLNQEKNLNTILNPKINFKSRLSLFKKIAGD